MQSFCFPFCESILQLLLVNTENQYYGFLPSRQLAPHLETICQLHYYGFLVKWYSRIAILSLNYYLCSILPLNCQNGHFGCQSLLLGLISSLNIKVANSLLKFTFRLNFIYKLLKWLFHSLNFSFRLITVPHLRGLLCFSCRNNSNTISHPMWHTIFTFLKKILKAL